MSKDTFLGMRVVTAAELFERLNDKRGHVCQRGMAPEGYLEVHPMDLAVLWLISCKEHELLNAMVDEARPQVREVAA